MALKWQKWFIKGKPTMMYIFTNLFAYNNFVVKR